VQRVLAVAHEHHAATASTPALSSAPRRKSGPSVTVATFFTWIGVPFFLAGSRPSPGPRPT
jgi:hypothetical protein